MEGGAGRRREGDARRLVKAAARSEGRGEGRRLRHTAVYPPSTNMVCPVTMALASDAR